MSSMGSRVRVSSRHPQAAAVCDRCGLWRNHVDLSRQMRYAGASVVWTGLLVCPDTCLDPLDPFVRARIVPPDGMPIRDPRPEIAVPSDAFGLTTDNGSPLATQTGIALEPERTFSRAERQFLTTEDGAFFMTHDGQLLTVAP